MTIFRDDQDYLRFLSLLKQYMQPVGLVMSYALMGNHFHLAVMMYPASRIDEKFRKSPLTLGRTFGHLQNAYAKYFNTKYEKVSGVFERSFERNLVPTLKYLQNLIIYHHRNPQHHGITDDWENYFWTSYQDLSHPDVATFLPRQLIYDKLGGVDTFFAAHRQPTPRWLLDEGEFEG